ncbi:hypothetical protein Fcan01_06060 [Folsomia candida]|uniref:ATP-dependent DNA helicase n=1 Tax=Folsomia candida TaxID=158441 RepID=A0A226EQG2_FOLCA|nr:hypothetical protein Fcan01_06060 [Folsomia candida]
MEHFNLHGIRLEDVVVHEDDLPPTPAANSRIVPRVERGYLAIPQKPWMWSMRLSFSQGSPRFLKSGTGGKQCTAISAVAAAYAGVRSPELWSVQDGDRILSAGDFYYQRCIRGRDAAIHGQTNADHAVIYDYLNPDEIEGEVRNAFGKKVNVSLVDGGVVIYAAFNKWMVDVDNYARRNIASAVEEFISLQHNYALITGGYYTMGLIKKDGHLYFFDSHGRTPQGMASHAANQQALILKLQLCQLSYDHICKIVNNNCVQGRDAAVLTITPLEITIVEDDNEMPLTPLNRNPEELINDIAPFGEDANDDCLIHDLDFVEPRLEKYIQDINAGSPLPVSHTENIIGAGDSTVPGNINLHRTGVPPINTRYETHLEEKCFIQCFPHGKYGLDEKRDEEHTGKLTPHGYFHTRVMSADSRFHRNDYLFYALSRSEQSIISSKIAVCGNMVYQDSANENVPAAENIHLYMSAIRGSKSYWKKYTGDIMALVTRLGNPTFFLTVSTDDIGSADILTAMWKASRNDPVPEDIQALPYEERRELLNSNPVAAARHFNLRTQELIKLLTSDPTIFGRPVNDYTFRVEFQDRGSPHLHSLIWVENAPDFSTPEGIAFIDQNVSCSLSRGSKMVEIIRRYQTHKNTPTCFKKGESCRFGFPRAAVSTTCLAPDEDSRSRGRGVILRRTEAEVWINNYHPKLLSLLRCNMDIQPVIGVAAVALYIAKYIGKNESETLREDIRRTLQALRESRQPIRIQMDKVARLLLNRRTVSSQECAARICNLPMRFSSRGFVFIPTFRPMDRIRMLRKDNFLNGNDVNFARNIIDKYCQRPENLDEICLFEFASKYRPNRSPQYADDDLDEGIEDEAMAQRRGHRPFYLMDRSMGLWIERDTYAIIKCPSFHSETDSANFIYSHLMLYIPFRNELELTIPGESLQNAYERRKNDMRTNANFPFIRLEMEKALESAVEKVAEFDEIEPVDSGDYFPDVFNASNVVQTSRDVYEIPLMDAQSFATELAKTNQDQKEIYQLVERYLDDSTGQQLKLFISGAGGTGKSFLISLLTNLIRTKDGGPGRDSVVLAAPTGVAT